MTFASDAVRLLFHTLPIEKQMVYVEMEKRLSLTNQYLQVDAVIQFNNILEVVIRIRSGE